METFGEVVGLSTNFTHDRQVDNEKSYRQYDNQQDEEDLDYNNGRILVSVIPDNIFDGLRTERGEQQRSSDLLRFIRRAVQPCLFTCIINSSSLSYNYQHHYH